MSDSKKNESGNIMVEAVGRGTQTDIDSAHLTATGAQKRSLISATAWMTIILSSMYGIMYLDRVNISIAAKDMMSEFSLTKTQIGFAFSAFAWPYLFGQLVGGWLANRFGARTTLAVCGLLVAVATIATGVCRRPAQSICGASRFGLR